MRTFEIADKYGIDRTRFETFLLENGKRCERGLASIAVDDEDVAAYVEEFKTGRKVKNSVVSPVQTESNNKLKASEKKKFKTSIRSFSLLGVFGGLLSVVFGFVVSNMSTGYWESSKNYGGDAYTGIQNAAAQTANNVQDLAEILKTGISFGLIVFGIAMISYFGLKIFNAESKKVSTYDVENYTRGEMKPEVQTIVDNKKNSHCANVQSAEESIPKSITHVWRCDECNKMRTQTPCEHCGKE